MAVVLISLHNAKGLDFPNYSFIPTTFVFVVLINSLAGMMYPLVRQLSQVLLKQRDSR